jgi:tetratricopeptide (TPR) repeat protein
MHFTGRAEELAKLDRWAADPEVSLVGVTAWGGAGKTALVTHWVQEAGGTPRRSAVRGVFGWNFYAESSAERWTATLLEWAKQQFGFQTIKDVRPAIQVLALLQKVPLLLVLDGLEVAQEWSAGDAFGRMLDGTLREVLTGACQVAHGGLVVLTSRFPFADLEAFDGTRARMLDVPPFTLDQGADLLAATGGAWLAEESRRELVQAVDGHALAVGVLARLLAGEPPRSDLQKLLVELAAAMRTDARVQRVLRFYAEQLPEPDRYLIAAISLFTRPVPVATVLIVARHEAFGGWLDGWTPAQVEAAAQDRLTGLVSMQPGNMLSAHPLVRDSFRRFVIGAAQAAVDITLSGLPDRPVTNRADAERLVEAIELLLEAEDWQAADNLYSRRTDSGEVWKHLPAARLGQRASIAFVADPARREACSQHLGRSRMASYLSRAGLCAMNAGDLPAAQEFFQQGIHSNRDAGDAANLSQDLQNLTECLGHLGKVDQASETSVEALAEALKLSDPWLIFRARSFNAWATALHGDTIAAGKQFSIADREHFTDKRTSHHLCSLWGVMWGEFLTATGRSGPAYMLTNRNRTTARQNHWNVDVALCDRLLGRISLISGDVNTASHKFASSTDSLRDGDYLVELATTLADLAECAGIAGELDAAENYIEEALLIAAPRGLVPAQSAALATRARIFANRATATGSRDLTRGRDAADAALRLAQRHHLLWNELAALRAHAYIDEVEGDTRGWAARTETLYKQLVPPKLDPNPLVTVERQVHKQSVKGESRNPNSKRNSRRQAEKSRRQNRRRRK